jgi:BlaI family penicillinase repressor
MAKPDISAAEWSVMEVLWKASPRTASEVFRELQESTGWALNTVRTMLTRLVEKGVVRAGKRGGSVTEFSAAVDRETCVKAESDSFLKRVFQGAANSLLLHFVENSSLTPEEAKKLKQVFEESAKRRR